MKVFVDTNVLIDYVCRREPFFVPAKSIFAICFLGKIEIIVSALSIVNTLYIGRKYGSDVLRTKLSSLSQIINIVDLSAEMTTQTLQTGWADYEDALQNATAINFSADCIVTRNTKDFKDSSLPVYTAEEFFYQWVEKESCH